MKIKITKRAEVVGGAPAASKDEYIPGSVGVPGHSIPVDYWVTGELLGKLAVGRSALVARETRNGIKCDGLFQSSPVTEMTESMFQTRNSVYDYEILS